MTKFTSFKMLLIALVMLVGSGSVVAAVGDVIYTLPGGTGQPFGSSNTYALKTGTYNSVSWTATLGSCQSASVFWLGSNSSNKAKLTLGATYAAVGTPCSIAATDTYVSALIAGSEFANVGKVTVANTSIGGTATTPSVYIVYSTNSGSSYSLAAPVQTAASAGTLTFEFTTIPSARYAVVVKGTNDYTVRVPVVTFYEGVTSGPEVVATPTFDPPAGNLFSAQNIAITSSTEAAEIYYTIDGSDPDNTDTQYTTPIAVNTTTTIKAIAYKSGMTQSPIVSATYTFPTNVSNVAALRAGTTDGTVYKLTGEALLILQSTGTGKPKYIQDATGGILVYDSGAKIATTYNIGDGITNIIGTLTTSTGMLQFIPVADPGAATSTGNTLTPAEIDLANLANYPGQLVKVSGVTITGTGNFVASTNYNLNSSATTILRTQYSDLNYIGQPIPTVPQDIVGVVLMYNTTAELVPRSLSDFSNTVFASPTIIVSEATVPAMTAQVGATDTETITVNAQNLTANISLAVTGTDASLFTLSTNSIAPTSGTVTDQSVTITYTPTAAGSHTATLTLSSTGAESVVKTLSGSATWPPLDAPVAENAGAISQSGFTAIWGAVSGATSYEVNVYTKEESGGNATDLFISEYGEGSSGNKKYVEIYNGKGTSVDLSIYSLKKATNGAGWSTTVSLTDQLANNDTYVVANNITDVPGADLYNSTFANWNGDDAIGLFKNDVLIDVFGTPDADPGTGWSIAGAANATVDHIIIRKSSVTTPNTNWVASAGTSTEDSEWSVSDFTYSSTDQTTNLGSHTFVGGGVSTTPVSGSPFTVTGETSKAITGLSASTTYYYTVVAKNANVDSNASNEISVVTSFGTGVDAPVLKEITAFDGKIRFSATAGQQVEVYNAVGQKLMSTTTLDGLNTLNVNAKGMMIVKVGDRLAKVIL